MPALSPAMMAVLEAGIAAPTGDNCQPWKIALRADGFDVSFVPELGRSFFDEGDLASRVALGAFLENVQLEASVRGLKASWQLSPEVDRPTLWARVALRAEVSAAPDPLAAHVHLRHANREAYSTVPLTDAQKSGLEANSDDAARISLARGDEPLAELRGWVAWAERVRAGCREAHLSTYPWFRWTPEQAERTRDGLDARTLGANAGQRLALRTLAPWPLMRVAAALGATRAMGAYAGDLVRKSGGMGVLAARSLEVADVVRAGQAFERCWLWATGQGLALSVLAALPLFVLRVQTAGGRGLPPSTHARLREAGERIKACFGLPATSRPLLMFRVGYGPAQAIVSLRRRVESFLEA